MHQELLGSTRDTHQPAEHRSTRRSERVVEHRELDCLLWIEPLPFDGLEVPHWLDEAGE